MAGWRHSTFFCYVFLFIIAQLRVLITLSTLAGRDPVYRMAADIRRFPAEMFCMYGWLFQTNLLFHWLQVCLMLRKDPITCRLIETNALPQATQMANSNIRADSNTRKISCYVLHQNVLFIFFWSGGFPIHGPISSTTGTIPPFFVIGGHEGEGKRLHCTPISHIDGIAWTPITLQ